MQFRQFPTTSNTFRLVVDRFGTVLRHQFSSQNFCSFEFPEDVFIQYYDGENSVSQQFTKSVISIEYSDKDISDLESNDLDRMNWIYEPIQIDWEGEILEYDQAKYWGTSVKSKMGLGVLKKIDACLSKILMNDEKRYFGERLFFANNISGLKVSNMKIKKVAGGTQIWSDTFLLSLSEKLGFLITQDDLEKLGRPIVKDGTCIMKASSAKLLWDEHAIQESRDLDVNLTPKVVHHKAWKDSAMLNMWIPHIFNEILLHERQKTIVNNTKKIYERDGNGHQNWMSFAHRVSGFEEEEDSIGFKLVKADEENMKHHPFICQQMLDSCADYLYRLCSTGYSELQGGILTPMSNPTKLYETHENLNVNADWKDNGNRIVLPLHTRFEHILDKGENSITRWPIDSPFASQIGLTFTTGFYTELFKNLRGIQYQGYLQDQENKEFFIKGDAVIIPDELWEWGNFDCIIDTEDVKAHEGVDSFESFQQLKQDYRDIVCRGSLGVKQIYGAGSLIWVSHSIGKGFHGDYDGDGGCIESGKEYPNTILVRKEIHSMYKGKLENPKLVKTFSKGDRIKTFCESLGGGAVVGLFTNISVTLNNLSGEEKEKVVQKLKIEYYYRKTVTYGYIDYNSELTLVDKLNAIVAIGIKVGTDCFKTKTDLKFWKKLASEWTAELLKLSNRCWLLDYNPLKDYNPMAFRTNEGLPIEYFKKEKPVSLADYIAKSLLVTGLYDDNCELIQDDDGNSLLVRLNNPLIDIKPLDYYKGWAICPQSSEETRICDKLFETHYALMEHYNFNSNGSFIAYLETIWSDVIKKALTGWIPKGVVVRIKEGTQTYHIKEYVRYGCTLLTKWRLANLLWWRFHKMERNSWRNVSPVILMFPEESLRIVQEKPGLNRTKVLNGLPVIRTQFTVPVSGQPHQIGIHNFQDEIEVYLLTKQVKKKVYKKDEQNKIIINKQGYKVVERYYSEYRMILTPCCDYENLDNTHLKIKELSDSRKLPERYCMVDLTSDWVVDENGLPMTGRYYVNFSRQGSKTMAHLMLSERIN